MASCAWSPEKLACAAFSQSVLVHCSQGAREEFGRAEMIATLPVPSSVGEGTLYVWRLVNGLWGLVRH